MKARHLVLSLVLALGCGVAMQIGAPLVPETSRLVAGSVSLAVPLAGDALLVDDGSALSIVRIGAEPIVIGASGEVGTLVAYTPYDGTTLVSGSAGTFVVSDSGIFRAPLDAALDAGESVTGLASSARTGASSDLWVSTDRGLYVFRDGALIEAQIEGTDLTSARITEASTGAIWVATDERVLRLSIEPGSSTTGGITLSASALERPSGADAIAADAEGVLWIVNDGELSALRRDDRIVVYPIPLTAESVYASPTGRDLWIRGTDGTFFHELDRIFRPVTGLEATEAWSGADGSLLARSEGGVSLFRARHPLALEGLHDGPVLETTSVTLVLPAQDHATSIHVDIDGIALDAAGTPPIFSIAPGVVGLGDHTLHVDVDYDDGTLRTSLSRPITVQSTVTYDGEIRPLYVTYCADCHGPTGPSPTRLDSMAPWMNLSSRILENVTTGRMPLGRAPIPPEAIALIETWVDAGFPP